MKAWIALHWRQLGIMALSVVAGLAIWFRPELRGPVLLGCAVLTGMGIQVEPIVIQPPKDPKDPSPKEPSSAPSVPPLLLWALGFVVLSACAAGAANAAYDRDLAACELSPTCETWVACRKTAATKNGRIFEAHCNADGTASDGGAP
jgi:hypothetical protein